MSIKWEAVNEAADYIRSRIRTVPRVALILGTGLGGVADHIQSECVINYSEIPGFPQPTVSEHQGKLIFGALSGKAVVAMQGRIHYYEGYPLDLVTFPVRVLRKIGPEILIINSAAGGLSHIFRSGDVMLVEDHINFIGQNPLRGLTDDAFGDRFPDMSQPYCPKLMELAESAALQNGIQLHKGVYVAVSGPSIETRAETRMLKLLGADCVGMSTVPEVITGVQVGFRIMAVAAVTNVNMPDCMTPVSFEQVLYNAKIAEKKLSTIIGEVISAVD